MAVNELSSEFNSRAQTRDDQSEFSFLSPSSKIERDVELEHPVFIDDLVEIRTHVRMGAFSKARTATIIRSNVKIGRFCSIARLVDMGASNHPLHFLSTHTFAYFPEPFERSPEYLNMKRVEWDDGPPTTVGNDVWVGTQAIIRAGVSIGDGAVIAAGAIVTKDVPAFSIVGGMPAHVMRYRFSDAIIERLLDLRWWDLPLGLLADLPFDDVESCIERLSEIRSNIESAPVAQPMMTRPLQH